MPIRYDTYVGSSAGETGFPASFHTYFTSTVFQQAHATTPPVPSSMTSFHNKYIPSWFRRALRPPNLPVALKKHKRLIIRMRTKTENMTPRMIAGKMSSFFRGEAAGLEAMVGFSATTAKKDINLTMIYIYIYIYINIYIIFSLPPNYAAT